jgi:Ras family.
VSRCIKNVFPDTSASGKDLSHRYNMSLNKKKTVCLDIVDFNGKNDALISCADGFIICYAIDNRKSFEAIDSYLDKIVEANIKSPKIAIVGNKIDLYNQREVTSNEGLELAKEINALFYETSAKVPVIDVRQVFYDLYQSLKNVKRSKKSKRGSFEFESSDVFSLLNYSIINNSGVIGRSSTKNCFSALLNARRRKSVQSIRRSWSADSM